MFQRSRELGARVRDGRVRPRIPAAAVVEAVLLMMWGRLGSLNALESLRRGGLWERLLGRPLCSADTIGEVCAGLDPDPLRDALRHVYGRLKRAKALPLNHGHDVAVLDGHESHRGYRRHCPGCLQRVVHTRDRDRLQYYHRHVALMLLPGPTYPGGPALRSLLDVEPQRPGEDETAAARRLLTRAVAHYPRAFDLLLADSLYASVPFIDFVRSLGKHLLVVFKAENRQIHDEALARMADQAPRIDSFRGRRCRWWDVPGLHLPLERDEPVRIVRSEETLPPGRVASPDEPRTRTWMWLTTLCPLRLPLPFLVPLGHQRWDIENHGFNETVNGWHADHVYRHHPGAMLAFLLLLCLAYNYYFAFCLRHLKPQLRDRFPLHYWARQIAAVLYAQADPRAPRGP